MPSTKGYRSYRGRGSVGKIVLIVVLCVLLLAAVGFLALQRYAVYETDGSIRFDLPWRSDETPDDLPSADGDELKTPEVIVEETEPDDEKKAPEALHAVALDIAAPGGDAEALLASLPEGTNAAAVRVKNEKGELLYASALTEAVEAGAVAENAVSLDALGSLTGSEYYTLACISALHDSIYSRAHIAETAIQQLKHPGNIWYNPESTFYLAPEKAGARAYIVSVARECAALGFDELLFDSFGYPDRGRLSNIDESARTMTKQEALTLLAQELREGTAEFGTVLSVRLDAASVLAGGNEKAGQELSSLAELFDRIYVETTAEELPALQAVIEPYAAELVPIVTEAVETGSYLIEN